MPPLLLLMRFSAMSCQPPDTLHAYYALLRFADAAYMKRRRA